MDKKEVFKDYFLKINGKCILPQRLKMAHNYKIETDIIVTDENKKINKDVEGSKNLYYTGELDGVATIKNEKGEVLFANKKGLTNSQKWRLAIESKNDSKLDDKVYYDYFMGKMLHFQDKVHDLLKIKFKEWE